MNDIIKYLKNLLDYYKGFKTKLYLILTEYDDIEEIKMAYYKVTGKVELLKEIIGYFKEKTDLFSEGNNDGSNKEDRSSED